MVGVVIGSCVKRLMVMVGFRAVGTSVVGLESECRVLVASVVRVDDDTAIDVAGGAWPVAVD